MAEPRSGRFITLEGGEGAGKSTQLALLVQGLRQAGRSVIATREPGGSPGAEEIRQLLVQGEPGRWDAVAEALLHCAARRDHLVRTIRPALERGDWVLCDRFADSTMAYQGYGLELGRGPVETLHRLTVGDFWPDLTIVLDLPVELGLARAAARSDRDNRYEQMKIEFHRRLRDGFLDIARREPRRCVVVDAAQSVEAVQAAIRGQVAARLGISLS